MLIATPPESAAVPMPRSSATRAAASAIPRARFAWNEAARSATARRPVTDSGPVDPEVPVGELAHQRPRRDDEDAALLPELESAIPRPGPGLPAASSFIAGSPS